MATIIGSSGDWLIGAIHTLVVGWVKIPSGPIEVDGTDQISSRRTAPHRVNVLPPLQIHQ